MKLILLLLLQTQQCTMTSDTSNLQVTTLLTAEKLNFKSGEEEIELLFSVRNSTEKKTKFCHYMTPFETISGNIFEIKNAAGDVADYEGIMRKRKEPTAENDIPVAAGQTVSALFTLQGSYDLSKPGTYTIRFKGNEYMNNLPDSNTLKITVE